LYRPNAMGQPPQIHIPLVFRTANRTWAPEPPAPNQFQVCRCKSRDGSGAVIAPPGVSKAVHDGGIADVQQRSTRCSKQYEANGKNELDFDLSPACCITPWTRMRLTLLLEATRTPPRTTHPAVAGCVSLLHFSCLLFGRRKCYGPHLLGHYLAVIEKLQVLHVHVHHGLVNRTTTRMHSPRPIGAVSTLLRAMAIFLACPSSTRLWTSPKVHRRPHGVGKAELK